MIGPETTELLCARIVSRLVALRVAGAIYQACDFSVDPSSVASSPSLGASLLWDWAKLLVDARALIDEVFEPALAEPGRRYQRYTQVLKGRPRGATHWPQTVQRAMRRTPVAAPDFICTIGERSMLAPENLLLIATLENSLSRGAVISSRIERVNLLTDDDRELFRRHRIAARRALAIPWVQSCREALHSQRLELRQLERALEAEVNERLRGQPCAAPSWARRLLALRRTPLRVPDLSTLRQLDPGELWQILGGLEALALLRRHTLLRQQETGHDFGDHRGLQFRTLPGAPVWVVTGPDTPAIALLRSSARDWESVRRDALYWCWTVKHEDQDIDRWLVLHRATDSPASYHPRTRRGIELVYWHLEPTHGPASALSARVDAWLAPCAHRRS